MAYLISGAYKTSFEINSNESKVLKPYTLRMTLKYAINTQHIEVENDSNRLMKPSLIIWINSILKPNEYDPFITTLPTQMISYCQNIIKGGQKLFDSFAEVAENLYRKDSNFNEERFLAEKYSKYSDSVIKLNKISLSKEIYMNNVIESQFHNILEHHFNDIDKTTEPFKESEEEFFLPKSRNWERILKETKP